MITFSFGKKLVYQTSERRRICIIFIIPCWLSPVYASTMKGLYVVGSQNVNVICEQLKKKNHNFFATGKLFGLSSKLAHNPGIFQCPETQTKLEK